MGGSGWQGRSSQFLGTILKLNEFLVFFVFRSLRRCQHGMKKNTKSLVMIYENGLNDARVECTLANEDVTELFALEMYLLESHEVELGQAKMFEEE